MDNDDWPSGLGPKEIAAATSSDFGLIYPPRDWRDIVAYSKGEMLAGFMSYRPGEPEPGPEKPPGFRWAWRNTARDCALEDDGFDVMRRQADQARQILRPDLYPSSGAASFQPSPAVPQEHP